MKQQILMMAAACLIAGFLGLFHLGGVLLVYTLFFLVYTASKGRFKGRRIVPAIIFLIDFIWDIVKSNFVMLYDALTIKDLHRIYLVKVPTSDLEDWELALLHHRINLSPGTLVCNIEKNGEFIIVHDMYGSGGKRAEELRAPIDILRGKKVAG